jgi:hypothetical protein
VRRPAGIQGGGPAAVEQAVVEADEALELEAAAEEVLELEVDVAEIEGGEEVAVEVKTSVSSVVVTRVVGL